MSWSMVGVIMALEGTLNYLDISYLLKVVGTSKKSGVLRIWHHELEAFLFFREGRLLKAESNRFYESLGGLLVEANLLSEENLTLALEIQKNESGKRRIGTILCDDFGIDSASIEKILRRQFERIVFDVFSWEEGSFTFHFQELEESLDRFHLDPVDFILNVGIQAGILAEEAMEKELHHANKWCELVFLMHDPVASDRCRAFYMRKDREIKQFNSASEVLAYLKGGSAEEPPPIVVADMFYSRSGGEEHPGGLELLDEIHSINKAVPVILLGDGNDQKARIAAMKRGAFHYVRKPFLELADEHEEDAAIEVFFMRLENAVHKAEREIRNNSGEQH